MLGLLTLDHREPAMRYSQSRKEDTRQLLLEKGAAEIKRAGFAATGVDRLMQAAGLSGGALYAHFPGKTALLVAIVQAELAKSVRMLTGKPEVPAAEALERCLGRYLSLEHVQHPESGCILPALAAELGRASPEVKAVVDAATQEFVAFWALRLGSSTAAQVLLNQCVGTILMARMSDDEARQIETLEGSRRFLLESLTPRPT
jgi:AcrR family transcriptional regulator